MPVELVVPSVGESITEVEIGDWLKKQGEPVNQDEPVVVIETQKVTVELPAPPCATLSSMLKQKGDKAAVGAVIGYLGTNGAPRPAGPAVTRDGGTRGVTPLTPVPSRPRQEIAPPSPGREEQIIPMTPI